MENERVRRAWEMPFWKGLDRTLRRRHLGKDLLERGGILGRSGDPRVVQGCRSGQWGRPHVSQVPWLFCHGYVGLPLPTGHSLQTRDPTDCHASLKTPRGSRAPQTPPRPFSRGPGFQALPCSAQHSLSVHVTCPVSPSLRLRGHPSPGLCLTQPCPLYLEQCGPYMHLGCHR